MTIHDIVKEKIADSIVIKSHTISCGEKTIFLYEKLAPSEIEKMFENTELFLETVKANIKPLTKELFPKVMLLFNGGKTILCIRGLWWNWI